MFSTRATSRSRSSATGRMMAGILSRRLLSSPPAPFTSDHLVSLAPRPHQDRLENPAASDGSGELIELLLRDILAWLMGVGCDRVYRDLLDPLAREHFLCKTDGFIHGWHLP